MKGLVLIKTNKRAMVRAHLVAAGKCPHTDTFHDRSARVEYAPGVEATPIDRHQDTGEPILSVLVEARRCHDCGAWLPIGESNDKLPQVAIEIRAAELAALLGGKRLMGARFPISYSGLGFDGAETAGHITYVCDSDKQPEQDGEWAGYLAAAIANHLEPS